MKVKEKEQLKNELGAFRQLLAELKSSENEQKQTKEMFKQLAAKLERIETECESIETELEKDAHADQTPAGAVSKENKRRVVAEVSPEIVELLDDLPFYVLLIDDRHEILMANKAMRTVLGLELSDIIGKHCPKVVHGVSGRFPGCPLEEAVEKDSYVEREVLDNNSGRWLSSCIYPTKLEAKNGRKIYLHLARDITDNKRAQVELKRNYESQAVFDAVLRISLMGISLEGQLELILQQVISIPWLGLESKGAIFLVEDNPEVLVMKAHRGLAKPLLAMCARVPFGRCICGRAASSGAIEFADRIDDRHENRYAGIVPHGHYCVPILSEGDVLGVINLYVKEGYRGDQREKRFLRAVADIVAGVVKRNRTEVELEEKVRLLDAATDSIFVHDFEGKFHYLNEAAYKSRGYAKDELLSTGLGALDVPEFVKLIEPRIKELMEKGESTFESAHFRRDKSVMPVEVHARIVDLGGKKFILSVARDVTERKRAQEELEHSFEQLRKTLRGTVDALASVVEMRDPYTAGHQQRVADLACTIAKEMGLPDEQIEGIRISGVIHDIGKIYVPAEILSKPGKLTETEFKMVQTHPQVGHDILKTIEFPWSVAEIVSQHHERINGSGYPFGLSGKDIILEARILAVADVVEAMASHRPYRPARGIALALEEISQNRGILYDAEVVDVCLRLFWEKGYKFK